MTKNLSHWVFLVNWDVNKDMDNKKDIKGVLQ